MLFNQLLLFFSGVGLLSAMPASSQNEALVKIIVDESSRVDPIIFQEVRTQRIPDLLENLSKLSPEGFKINVVASAEYYVRSVIPTQRVESINILQNRIRDNLKQV